jgi:hypothetical protein
VFAAVLTTILVFAVGFPLVRKRTAEASVALATEASAAEATLVDHAAPKADDEQPAG